MAKFIVWQEVVYRRGYLVEARNEDDAEERAEMIGIDDYEYEGPQAQSRTVDVERLPAKAPAGHL